ncbi:MAG: pentapeptide repeat-containing protein [Cyanobacteria bacterium P01_D01_bin.44]
MSRPRLTAKELRRRYRQGERNFAGVDLSGESLQGMNLRAINLSNADLSYTNIRGTNFTKADLKKVQFVGAEAGNQRHWIVLHFLCACISMTFASLCYGSFFAALIMAIINPLGSFDFSNTNEFPITTTNGSRLAAFLGFLSFVILSSFRSQNSNIRRFLFSFLVFLGTVSGAISRFFINDSFWVGVFGLFSGISLTLPYIIFGTYIIPVNFSGAIFGVALSLFSFLFGRHLNFIIITFSSNQNIQLSMEILAVLGVISVTFFNFKEVRQMLNSKKDRIKFQTQIWVRSFGGTKFVGADLTDACFLKAFLGDSHIYKTILTRTQFHLVKKLEFSRFENTILEKDCIRSLLVTLRGAGQSYAGFNLKGVNLRGADLVNADFTEANLSDATLEEAMLEGVIFTETQALRTNFRKCILTGANISSWNIDSTTQLEGVVCDYIYLFRDQQRRCPNSGMFGPGEFTKLFQKVFDTVDLIFSHSIDWKAFTYTLKQVQVKYDDAQLSVQSVEDKGDGFMVVKLNAAPEANKPAIHESFTEIYQLALKAVEAQYKNQLHAKDSEIQIYRQQSADMVEILKLQAQRPIINQATAESRAMQGDDLSISIGGNATGSVFQTGNENTANLTFQPVTLPPPETVNIQAELLALRNLLASLNDPVTDGFAQKLESEAQKPEPNRDVVGQTLETGLTYAKNLQGFAETMEKLRPHVQNAASWLGQHWYKILSLVGLAAL